MLTYQVRQRVFRVEGDKPLPFPEHGYVEFHFGPKQPFGMEAGGGLTAVQNIGASVLFNANNGKHFVESREPLAPLDVTVQEPERTTRLLGNVLTISQQFESNQQLTEIIESFYYGSPMLLAVDFADPPIVERVAGCIGRARFRWELQNWHARFETTTQERQEQAFVDALDRMSALSQPSRRRLLAGLHYFHVAVRLARRGEVAGEFLAEMILNLSKTLEVLFPPSGDGKTRDAVRKGLRSLGFSDGEIEGNYLPCMALRNEIDVGHVDLSLFSVAQLTVIHEYVERSEAAFRSLFKRALDRLTAGQFDVQEYNPMPAAGEALRVIERLRNHAETQER